MRTKQEFFKLLEELQRSGRTFFRPILMQFAAQFAGKSYRELYTDHNTLVDANIACMEKFGTDAVGLISDPFREAEAFGLICEYPDNAVPKPTGYPIKTMEDVANLSNPDVYISKRTLDRIDGARLFRERLGDEIPLIGWIEGPLAEACDLVGVSDMLIKLVMEPGFCRGLLAKAAVTAKDFARAQIENGCDIIGMGDAICSQISASMYREFVLDLHKEIIQDIHSQGALVKVHICGDISHILADLKTTNPDIVDIDCMVDMENAYEVLGPEIIRCGNLDPAALIEKGSAEEVFNRTRELVESELGRPFILSGGCEITPLTPHENLMAMREASVFR
jgi:uroporphyrinogen decarboxylase